MKRLRTAALLLALALPLAGCMQTVRLKDRAIIQAVGVDYSGGNYRLTFQYFVPEEGGGAKAADAASSNTFSAEGATMTEAVAQAERLSGRRVFFGSNKLVILGEGLAREGAKAAVGYFTANHQLDPGAYVLLTAGDAADIVAPAGGKQAVEAAALEKLADTASRAHRMDGGTVLDAVGKLEGDGAAANLPLLTLARDGSGKPEPRIEGSALLRDGKLAGTLDAEQTEGVLWLNAHGKMDRKMQLVTLPQGEKCSLEILSSRTRKRPRLEADGSVVFDIAITVDSALREISSGAGETPDLIEAARRAQEKKILQQVHLALEKAVGECGADIFRLGAALRKDLPGVYRQRRADYGALLEEIAFHVEISCNISRMGLEAAERKG